MLSLDSMEEAHRNLLWQELYSKLLKRLDIFDLYKSRRRSPAGQEGTFYLLETRDWVNVVPPVADERGRSCFLMVRQFRQGISRLTVEFPAGLIENGERPQEAALRELAEETGYRAGSLELIGTIAANPAFMNNTCYTFLARDLHDVTGAESAARPDELELLDVLKVPADELEQRIGQEPFLNSMTALALFWYRRSLAALRD